MQQLYLVAGTFAGSALCGLLIPYLLQYYLQRRLRDHGQKLVEQTREEICDFQEQQEKVQNREIRLLDLHAKNEIQMEENRINHLENDTDESEEEIQEREKALQNNLNALAQIDLVNNQDQQLLVSQQQKSFELNQQHTRQLERLAQVRKQDVIDELCKGYIDRAQMRYQMQARQYSERIKQNDMAQGRRIMCHAINRYNGVAHLERLNNVVGISDAKLLLDLGDPENILHKTFIEEIDCRLSIHENTQAIIMRSENSMALEIARRVMRQVANRSIQQVSPIRDLAQQATQEVDREVTRAGRRAFKTLGLPFSHPDIMHLVGRLKFRLSYSQNQWKHSVEVAYLSGLMADELGLNVEAARRGGLLHDIGKAMTHDHEGGHAVLGAQEARRCGEAELIANCIGSHHFDEQPASPLAYIVTAADAMSGARPGARRESTANYIQRIKDIQNIACRDRAVAHVDIMQAGREVRVFVGPNAKNENGEMVADSDLYPLAQKVAQDIEDEVAYAGQIKVTVIRESRENVVAG